MTLLVKEDVSKQLKAIANQRKDTKKLSVLIGSVDAQDNKVSVISVIHFIKKPEIFEDFSIDQDDINQLTSLKYILPYSLEIVGLVFYSKNDFTYEIINKLQKAVTSIKSIITFARCTSKTIDYFTIAKEKAVKLSAKEKELKIESNVSIMHTIECETSAEVIVDISKMKKVLIQSFNDFWSKITFNKDEKSTLISIASEKSPLDRIVEIIVPYEEKGLTTRTGAGNVFLAFDLHMNIYPKESIQEKPLVELKEVFNKAFTRDLIVKLQRSSYDRAIKSLVPPKKTTMRISGVECNTYISKDNPSKFEFDLMVRLIDNAIILRDIEADYFARVLLQDLRAYFVEFEDVDLIKKVDELIWN